MVNKYHIENKILRQLALLSAIVLTGGNLVFDRIAVASILIFVQLLLNGPTFGLLRREFISPFILILIMWSVAIYGADAIITNDIITRLVNFSIGLMCLATYLKLPRFTLLNDIEPLLKIMCWQAIITFVLGSLFFDLFKAFVVEETIYYTIGWIFTFHAKINEGSEFVRANGLFFEPGVFQMYLNIFVFIAAILRKKSKDIVLGVAAVFSTYSTTGLFLVAAILIIYVFQSFRNGSFSKRHFLLILAPLLVVPAVLIFQLNAENKIYGEAKGSSWAREYDTRTGLAVAAENPLIGIGFEYDRYYAESMKLGYSQTQMSYQATINRGNSNGIVTALYCLGFPLALVLFIGLYRQIFFTNRIIFFFIVFISLMTEALFFNPFIIMLFFSGLLLSGGNRNLTEEKFPREISNLKELKV